MRFIIKLIVTVNYVLENCGSSNGRYTRTCDDYIMTKNFVKPDKQ